VDLKDKTHMLESRLANVSKAVELSLNNFKLIATEQRVRIKLIYKKMSASIFNHYGICYYK